MKRKYFILICRNYIEEHVLREKTILDFHTYKTYYNAAAAADDDLEEHNNNMCIYISPILDNNFLHSKMLMLSSSTEYVFINICCRTIDTVTLEQRSALLPFGIIIGFWNY